MAFTCTSLWKNPYVDYGVTDGRAASVYNAAGSNVINSTTFDYFPDTAVANNAITFSWSQRFWGIKLNVATAFSASAVEFIWEYSTGHTTWATLRVTNQNALLSTGVQIVSFTPPTNWYSVVDSGCKVRCRIVSVTSITEGGANGTDRVLFDKRPLVVTGSVSSMSTAYTSDLAGSYEILPASTPAASLTPIQMSVYEMKVSTTVDVVLSGCTLGAGDTVVLTGLDDEGGAISETIDVSGGDGTYTSTVLFSDITDVACTGFSDGTITVNQNRWGVIQNTLYSYQLVTHLHFGDGSTSTTVSLTGDDYCFANYAGWFAITVTLTLGTTKTVNGEPWGIRGVSFKEYWAPSVYNYIQAERVFGVSTVVFNACVFKPNLLTTQHSAYNFRYGSSSTVTFRDCQFIPWADGGNVVLPNPATNYTFIRTKFLNCALSISAPFNTSSNKIATTNQLRSEASSGTMLFDTVEAPSCVSWPAGSSVLTFLDTTIATSSITIGWTGYGSRANYTYIKYRFDLKAVESDGTAISGATVTITDAGGTQVFSGTTDEDGDITQQQLNYYIGDYVKNVGYSWNLKTPHTVTISKTGYQTKTMVLTMDRKREEIVVLEKVVKFITAGGDPLLWNLAPTNSQNKHNWAKV